jgi:hypothetical protein
MELNYLNKKKSGTVIACVKVLEDTMNIMINYRYKSEIKILTLTVFLNYLAVVFVQSGFLFLRGLYGTEENV